MDTDSEFDFMEPRTIHNEGRTIEVVDSKPKNSEEQKIEKFAKNQKNRVSRDPEQGSIGMSEEIDPSDTLNTPQNHKIIALRKKESKNSKHTSQTLSTALSLPKPHTKAQHNQLTRIEGFFKQGKPIKTCFFYYDQNSKIKAVEYNKEGKVVSMTYIDPNTMWKFHQEVKENFKEWQEKKSPGYPLLLNPRPGKRSPASQEDSALAEDAYYHFLEDKDSMEGAQHSIISTRVESEECFVMVEEPFRRHIETKFVDFRVFEMTGNEIFVYRVSQSGMVNLCIDGLVWTNVGVFDRFGECLLQNAKIWKFGLGGLGGVFGVGLVDALRPGRLPVTFREHFLEKFGLVGNFVLGDLVIFKDELNEFSSLFYMFTGVERTLEDQKEGLETPKSQENQENKNFIEASNLAKSDQTHQKIDEREIGGVQVSTLIYFFANNELFEIRSHLISEEGLLSGSVTFKQQNLHFEGIFRFKTQEPTFKSHTIELKEGTIFKFSVNRKPDFSEQKSQKRELETHIKVKETTIKVEEGLESAIKIFTAIKARFSSGLKIEARNPKNLKTDLCLVGMIKNEANEVIYEGQILQKRLTQNTKFFVFFDENEPFNITNNIKLGYVESLKVLPDGGIGFYGRVMGLESNGDFWEGLMTYSIPPRPIECKQVQEGPRKLIKWVKRAYDAKLFNFFEKTQKIVFDQKWVKGSLVNAEVEQSFRSLCSRGLETPFSQFSADFKFHNFLEITANLSKSSGLSTLGGMQGICYVDVDDFKVEKSRISEIQKFFGITNSSLFSSAEFAQRTSLSEFLAARVSLDYLNRMRVIIFEKSKIGQREAKSIILHQNGCRDSGSCNLYTLTLEDFSGKRIFPKNCFTKKIQGNFKKGYPEMKGTIFYRNGAVYSGEIRFGRRHGRGKMKFKNGEIYEGEWKNNDRSGQGSHSWPNGDRFEGIWFLNSASEGTLTLSSGVSIEGLFRCGEPILDSIECFDADKQQITIDELNSKF